jgi:DNA-binding protein YbaB
MAHNEVQMDFQAVHQAAQTYQQLAQQLQQVYQQLQQIGQQLQTAAFMGAVGAEAAKMVVDVLRMLVQLRINKFTSLSSEMNASVAARMLGDTNAKPNFTTGNGINLGG